MAMLKQFISIFALTTLVSTALAGSFHHCCFDEHEQESIEAHNEIAASCHNDKDEEKNDSSRPHLCFMSCCLVPYTVTVKVDFQFIPEVKPCQLVPNHPHLALSSYHHMTLRPPIFLS